MTWLIVKGRERERPKLGVLKGRKKRERWGLTRAGPKAWNAVPKGLDILKIPIGQNFNIGDLDRGQLQLRRRHSAVVDFITGSSQTHYCGIGFPPENTLSKVLEEEIKPKSKRLGRQSSIYPFFQCQVRDELGPAPP